MAFEINTGQHRGIEKIPTPLDERDLVDVHQLAVDLGEIYKSRGMIHLGDLKIRNVHHLYFDQSDYFRYDEVNGTDIATRFRERQVNKILLPIPIHRDIHDLFLKPPIPDPEVMAHAISSEFSLRILYTCYRQAIRWERDLDYLMGSRRCIRQPRYPTEQLHSKIKGALNVAEQHRALYAEVPKEARIDPRLNPDLPLETISKKIGEFLQLRNQSWKLALVG